ncbi:MAG: hypothetical protein V3U67_03085 [Gemmatimonadota bacterium]
MTEERRYSEEEVTEIFEAAARERKVGERALVSADGLTLAQLQTIAGEVGLAPERVSEEAVALDLRRDAVVRQTYLGMPITAGRSIDLPRAPTDREWETLVAELRETFGAQGKLGSHGSLREWSNGNLHASIEPTATGHRLRLGTRKGNALLMGNWGITGIAVGLILLAAGFLTGNVAGALGGALFFAAMGAAALTSGVLGLPRWARKRDRQMAFIAARARALIGPEPEDDGKAT